MTDVRYERIRPPEANAYFTRKTRYNRVMIRYTFVTVASQQKLKYGQSCLSQRLVIVCVFWYTTPRGWALWNNYEVTKGVTLEMVPG